MIRFLGVMTAVAMLAACATAVPGEGPNSVVAASPGGSCGSGSTVALLR